MPDLVGNPEDRFSDVAAHIVFTSFCIGHSLGFGSPFSCVVHHSHKSDFFMTRLFLSGTMKNLFWQRQKSKGKDHLHYCADQSVPLFIPLVYEVYRGYIVFAFSVCLCVCNHFFSSKISQQLLDLGF